MEKVRWWHILLLFVCAKIALHLFTNGLWSFHRDALLYLALGRHLDWGYASVPPSIGFFGWLGTQVLGGSVEAVRLIPTFFATATVVLTALMAREMLPARFSGKWAAVFVGLTGLLSGAYLRPGMLFQPVVFDIFYWALFSWMFIKLANSGRSQWLLWLGAAMGLGLLNKYLALLFVVGMLPGLLFTEYRKWLLHKHFYLAVGIALLIFLPNLIWQFQHQFPVLRHMTELAQSQFVHVEWDSFLADQLLFHLPALPLWLAGLYFLLFKNEGKPWRPLGWMYLTVLIFLLALSAKSYYTLGAYPVLVAAGAAFWERWSAGRWWLPTLLVGFMLAISILRFPVVLPVLPPEQLAQYFEKRKHKPGMEGALRWEDGETHTLPQDFADMLGWEEIAEMTGRAWQRIPDKTTAGIYAENYGMAGAIEHFGKPYAVPQVLSFSDNYRYWLPDSLPTNFQTLIYVNDELGDDMPGFFAQIEEVGRLDMPLSRQHGTLVFICRQPTPAFFERIGTAVKRAKNEETID